MLPNIFHRPPPKRKHEMEIPREIDINWKRFSLLVCLNFRREKLLLQCRNCLKIVSLKIVFLPPVKIFTKRSRIKNICLYLHFKMKNFLRLEIHATLVETRKLPKLFSSSQEKQIRITLIKFSVFVCVSEYLIFVE